MYKLTSIVAIVLALTACGEHETDQRGIELMPDMYHTPASKSQTAGTMQVEGRDSQGKQVMRQVEYPAMLTPPEGTIARSFEPYALAANDLAGANALRNPYAGTPAALRRGQEDFLVFCAACHGRDGNATHGYIAKQFSGILSLNVLATLQKTDGELYHVISHGRGRMMSMRAQLPSERRWGVVSFVKAQARASLAADPSPVERDLARAPNDPVLRFLAQQAREDSAALRAVGNAHEFFPAPRLVPAYESPTWPEPEGHK